MKGEGIWKEGDLQTPLKEAEAIVTYQSTRSGDAMVGRSRGVSLAASSPGLTQHLTAWEAQDLPAQPASGFCPGFEQSLDGRLPAAASLALSPGPQGCGHSR